MRPGGRTKLTNNTKESKNYYICNSMAMNGEITWTEWQDVEPMGIEETLGIRPEARMGESFSEKEGRAVHFQRRDKRQWSCRLPVNLFDDE